MKETKKKKQKKEEKKTRQERKIDQGKRGCRQEDQPSRLTEEKQFGYRRGLEPNQPLSRVPSTYHQCNSYNVSTQVELVKEAERERGKQGGGERAGEGERVLMLWDISVRGKSSEGRCVCTKGTPTMPSRTFTPTGAYLSLSLSFFLSLFPSLFSTPAPRCIRGVPPSPRIMYSPLFIRIYLEDVRVLLIVDETRNAGR